MNKVTAIFSGLLFALLILASCSEEWPPNNGGGGTEPIDTIIPAGKYIGISGCKFTLGTRDDSLGDIKYDCIKWEYNQKDMTLKIIHVNAAFNCCPEPLNLMINIRGNAIVIDESDAAQGCKCLCLNDVDYAITDLKPGAYKVMVQENMPLPDQQLLEFTMDLTKEPTGGYCVPRSIYPWTD